MPGDPGATVVTNARATYSTRAAAGATGTRHSPLPLGVAPRPLLGERFMQNSGASRRGDAKMYFAVIGCREAHKPLSALGREKGGDGRLAISLLTQPSICAEVGRSTITQVKNADPI